MDPAIKTSGASIADTTAGHGAFARPHTHGITVTAQAYAPGTLAAGVVARLRAIRADRMLFVWLLVAQQSFGRERLRARGFEFFVFDEAAQAQGPPEALIQ